MQLNGKQLAAVLKVGGIMVQSDGILENKEIDIMFHEYVKFGVPADQIQILQKVANAMDLSEMIKTLAQLSDDMKKYVVGYLATIMIADGNIDDSEVKMWKVISTLCGFPTMNIHDAVEYWRNH
jgi:uncharacterized tellurite resistance protein B-like protein